MNDTWKPEPGIYPGVSWDRYMSIPYISPSTLKHGLRSMKRLKRGIDGELQPSAKTTAIGQAVHCIIANERDRLAVMPAFEQMEQNVTATGKRSTSKATKFYKESAAAWEYENAGKEILTDVQMNVAKKVVDLLFKNQAAKRLIDRSEQELTIIGEIAGVMVKTRIDGAVSGEGHVWDLKTCPDVAPFAFYRHAKKLGYWFQFAFHQLALASAGSVAFQIQKYEVIATEVDGDYDNGVLLVPNQLLDDWAEKVIGVVEQYRVAKANDVWPGLYPAGIGMVEVPDYDMAENGVKFDELEPVDETAEANVYF